MNILGTRRAFNKVNLTKIMYSLKLFSVKISSDDLEKCLLIIDATQIIHKYLSYLCHLHCLKEVF